MNNSLTKQAQDILRQNDRGGYCVPTAHLYPFQWYWDSVICAMGWQTFDEERAWTEMDFLLKAMQPDGFLPHIIFHQPSDEYFPGADFWGTADRALPGSRISQPPILALGYWYLYKHSKQPAKHKAKLQELFPLLCQHYIWWTEHRQPERVSGLLASLHPWETGMDNSPVWDEPFKKVPEYDGPYERKDDHLVDAAERPTKEQYDKYLYIVKLLREGASGRKMMNEGPFSVYDLCIISLYHRSAKDLLALGAELGLEVPDQIKQFMVATAKSINHLWLEEADGCGYFATRDVLTDKPLPQQISACFLPLYAGLASKEQAAQLNQVLLSILDEVSFGIPSTAADEDTYDSCRYWRGPVWLHINWMVAQGLEQYGFADTAARLRADIVKLVEQSGFYEYYDSQSGAGCGGGDFSWTAAAYLLQLRDSG